MNIKVSKLKNNKKKVKVKETNLIETLGFVGLWALLTWKTIDKTIGHCLGTMDPIEMDECVPTGNSKLYLGKVYTEEKIKELSEEEVGKLFNNYSAKLSGQMVKSLGKSIINMYSMGACSALRISNQEALSEDLENDPFLNSALQRFTCELYYKFGLFLASLSVGIITSRHYLSERNKNGERTNGTSATGDEKQPSRLEVIGVLGFWFGI